MLGGCAAVAHAERADRWRPARRRWRGQWEERSWWQSRLDRRPRQRQEREEPCYYDRRNKRSCCLRYESGQRGGRWCRSWREPRRDPGHRRVHRRSLHHPGAVRCWCSCYWEQCRVRPSPGLLGAQGWPQQPGRAACWCRWYPLVAACIKRRRRVSSLIRPREARSSPCPGISGSRRATLQRATAESSAPARAEGQCQTSEQQHSSCQVGLMHTADIIVTWH